VVACLGVLLAGGRGTRLGLEVPKALARLGGLTLLERGLATLRASCDAVVVAAPAWLALPLDPLARVDDVSGAGGPLAGLVAGLGARSFERALALGVDFPLVSPGLLEALRDRLGAHAAVLPAPGGVLQPLVAAYAPGAVAALAAALRAGERSPTRALRGLGVLALDDAALATLPGGPASLHNVNTAGDLAEAARRLAAAGDAAA
jgi:molybdopterin-guanine dinucleotide biosynthesis protein A